LSSLDRLERHRRFWTGEPVDQPLQGVSREGAFFLQPFVALGVPDGDLRVADVPAPPLFRAAYYEPTLAGDPTDGDLLWVAKPPRALPWMEAIIGCCVEVAHCAQAMSALAPGVLPDLDRFDAEANAWLGLMTAFTRELAEWYGLRVPIGQTLMRGPSDMLAAFLGQGFYTEMIDHPDRIKRLARQCTQIWIQVLKSQYQHIPRYRGGYVSGIMGIWAPGPVAVYQEDAAGFISRQMYQEFFWEGDAAIAAAFEYSLLHLHSAALQHLELVLAIPQLTAVNVVVDPRGPALPDLIPDLQRIQRAGKALHLHGDLSEADLQLARSRLAPAGLCLWVVREK